MSASTEQRKLAAIMFTDMVGYSALAHSHEALALELLEEHRRLVRQTLPRHGGREVKTTGDGFLLEFPSALAAVQGAVEIQSALHQRNQVSPPERQLRIRIGIHVGDVVSRDGDIHGDGVNIAARLEPLAPAGGICVSNAVYEQVRNKLERPFASLGPAELKNIELPVTVHRVVMPWEKGPTLLPPMHPRRKSEWWKAAAALLVVALVAITTWKPWSRTGTSAGSALTETQKLTRQARTLIDDDPLAVRENYRLAEELGQRAVQLDPTDAEAWATLARASLNMVLGRYDDTPARRESVHSQAERAIRLAPDSLEAGLAMAGYSLVSRQYDEGERRTRELLRRHPTDQRAVTLLAWLLESLNRPDEVRKVLLEHTNTVDGLTTMLDWEAYDRFDRNDLLGADELLDQLFGRKPTANSYLTRMLVLWVGWGDLPAAAEFVQKMPSQLLLEDAFAHHAANIWLESGQTEKALEALRRIPRDFLEEKRVIRPKGLVMGRILQAANRTAAAEAEWKQALLLVERRQVAEPGRPDLVRLKALLLAYLGDKTEAQKQLRLWLEMTGVAPEDEGSRSLEVQMALGNHEEVIRGFQNIIQPKKGRWLNALNLLRHDPLYAPVRSDPRAQEMIATGANWLNNLLSAKLPKGGNPAGSALGQ